MPTGSEHKVASRQEAPRMNIYLIVCWPAEEARFDKRSMVDPKQF
jgi:hypothetical protein